MAVDIFPFEFPTLWLEIQIFAVFPPSSYFTTIRHIGKARGISTIKIKVNISCSNDHVKESTRVKSKLLNQHGQIER
jgi:hypothetical protein